MAQQAAARPPHPGCSAARCKQTHTPSSQGTGGSWLTGDRQSPLPHWLPCLTPSPLHPSHAPIRALHRPPPPCTPTRPSSGPTGLPRTESAKDAEEARRRAEELEGELGREVAHEAGATPDAGMGEQEAGAAAGASGCVYGGVSS